MGHEVGVIKRQYLLGGLISLRVVEQAWQCLEVAVELFYSDKKLTYRNLVRLLQRVGDVVLEGLARIMTEHLQQVKRGALIERVLSLGRSLQLCDSFHVFPRTVSHLGLYDFSPWLTGLIGEEISVQLKNLCSSHDDSELRFFNGL